jgi:hypothetical protein
MPRAGTRLAEGWGMNTANLLAAPVLVVLLSSLAGCSGASPAPRPVENATPDPTPGNAAPETTVTSPKAPIAGLVDMQDISWHNVAGGEPSFTMSNVSPAFDGIFGGIVVNATWDAIEPTQGGALDFDAVDAALAQVAAYNAAHPATPMGTKLRVYGGANAPAWAKQIGGGPISIQRNPKGCASGDCPLTIGPMWNEEYIAAWRSFQAALAARYDAHPLVRHVTVTSCAQQTDEPFVPTVDPASKANLVAAGYSDAAQKACLLGAVDDYAPWKLTNVDYTINAFVQTGAPADQDVFPASVMDASRAKFGSRCVLGNHALSAPLRAADQGVYDAIASRGGAISFQTEAPQGMGCLWTQTVARGVALGAGSVEVWPKQQYGGFDGFSADEMSQLASELVTPIAPDASPTPMPTPCSGFH